MFDVMVASDHWQHWFGLLVWLLVSGGPNRVACQDSAELTFRQTVAEVRLTLVGTEHGQGVANLSSRDFAVVDNDDIIRSFTGFVPAEKMALDVTVLVDGSESVLSHFKQEIAEAMLLESVAGGLPEDKLSLIAFRSSRPEIVCAGNCRQMHAFDRLSSLPVESSTPLFDSLELAARLLSQRRDPQVQPVLIVFSDGQERLAEILPATHCEHYGHQAHKLMLWTAQVRDTKRERGSCAPLQTLPADSIFRWRTAEPERWHQ
jgi:hypothetical protein